MTVFISGRSIELQVSKLYSLYTRPFLRSLPSFLGRAAPPTQIFMVPVGWLLTLYMAEGHRVIYQTNKSRPFLSPTL